MAGERPVYHSGYRLQKAYHDCRVTAVNRMSAAPDYSTRRAATTGWSCLPGPEGAAPFAPLDWILALLAGLVALGLQLAALWHVSLWEDELFSVDLAREPLGLQLRYIWSKEVNGTLYYLTLRGWLWLTRIFGARPDELVGRMPSVVFDALSVVAVFLLGRRFLGRTAGLVAAALYLVDYLQLFMAGQARQYSMQLFFIAVGWYALLAVLATGDGPRSGVRGRWYALYAGAMLLAIWAHLLTVLILCAQVVALGGLLTLGGPWGDAVRRSLRGWIASFSVIGLALLPLALDVALHGGSNNWLPPATPRGLVRLAWVISGHNVAYAALLAGVAAWGLGAAVRARVAGGLQGSAGAPMSAMSTLPLEDMPTLPWGPVVALLCWLVAPVVLAYALSQPRLNLHLFADYLVVVVPPLCLLAGAGVASLTSGLRARGALARRRAPAAWAGGALGALLVLLALPGVRVYRADVQRQNFRDAALWMQSRYRPGDGVIPLTISSALGMEYYLPVYLGQNRLIAAAPGRFYWPADHRLVIDTPVLRAYGAAHPRVFLVSAGLDDGGSNERRQAALTQVWLWRNGYRRVEAVTAQGYYHQVTVELYARDASELRISGG